MGIFFDVLEINIVVSVIFLFLFLFSEKLRKRYGAGWMKLVWVLLVLRLVIPYNFSLQPSRCCEPVNGNAFLLAFMCVP